MRDRPNDTLHRTVAATKLGRPLKPSEVAHHENEDKSDNSTVNINTQTRSQHSKDHASRRPLSKLRSALRMVKEGRKSY